MKTTAISITAFLLLIFNAIAQQPDYSQLKAEAEAQYAQGSYARANETYARVDRSKLAAADVRWVEFRLADTSWRAQAGTATPDQTKYCTWRPIVFSMLCASRSQLTQTGWAELSSIRCGCAC